MLREDLRSRLRRLDYSWWVLAASVIVMTIVSGLAIWSLGLYVRPLESEFGWSRTQVSVGFSISVLVSGLAGPFIGWWVDRFGPRSALLVGSALSALSYLLLASVGALWQWYAFAAINAGFRQMMFFIPLQALVSRWFDRRRGTALSILGTGFSLGGFVMLPMIALVIESTSWRGGFVFSGVAAAAVIVPIALLVLRDRPSDRALPSDERHTEHTDGMSPRGDARSLTLTKALRLPLFWVLAPALMLFFFGLIGWTVHVIPFFESRGLSSSEAALLVSLASGAGIVSRLAVGIIADRMKRFEVAAAVLIGLVVCAMGSLLLDAGNLGIAAFLGFWIIGTSVGSLAETLTLTRAFGLAHFATILGTVVVIETFGEILSPSLAGAIFDRTGSYDLALVMYMGTFATSMTLFAIASRMKRPLDSE